MANPALPWLSKWFDDRGLLNREPDEALLAANYFEETSLESLDVFELIDDIEARFGIEFRDEHFQERRFSTISGLADLIEELRVDAERTA